MALFVGDEEDALFRSRAFDFVILDDELLLQHFDGVELFRRLRLRQHDLSEITFTKHGEKVEVSETDARTGARRVCRWRSLAVLWTWCSDQRRCLRR